ncbi:PspC domain-containing protein [Marmoricola sp. URHB0036]|uniref:PspC domain-containing protein n=1 Tax=Marmoricola sp. URHB0036 TaxID=1298863 RepID=UPI00040D958A|nr:PspC domain-containing protein [Marmoricola sp. URHB0036]
MTEQQTNQPTDQSTDQSTDQQTHQQAQTQPPPPGQAQGQTPGYYQGQYPPPPYRRLTRTSWDAPISGVCGGLARYFGLDPTLVRVLAVLLAVFTFPAAIIAYIVAWAVMPKE